MIYEITDYIAVCYVYCHKVTLLETRISSASYWLGTDEPPK